MRPGSTWWATLWRRRRSPGGGAALQKVRLVLDNFGAQTEEAFLPVGEELMAMQSAADEIAAQSSAIADLLSQDKGSLAILDGVLQGAREQGESRGALDPVRELQENAGAIGKTLESFGPLINTFDVLGVMTRIESSRFAARGADFGGLADAVTRLSLEIRGQIGATVESAAVLRETASRAGREVARQAHSRQENLGPLMQQTSAGLARMGEHRDRVARANTLFAERFSRISHTVGDLVTALQTHDIVRQQIEHVVEALARAGDEGAECDRAEVALLQAAQLDNARETLARSVQQIRDALTGFQESIADVAEESGRLLGSSSESSIFRGVNRQLNGILDLLESNTATDRAVAEFSISVRQRVSAISQTIAGVRVVGIQMQRNALNTTLQAAHLGLEGLPLERVAHAIRSLAQEAETAADSIENHLAVAEGAARKLEEAATREAGADSEGLTGGLRRSVQALDSLEAEAGERYNQVKKRIDRLQQQIGQVLASFGSQDGILQKLAAAAGELREFAGSAGSLQGATREQNEATYTMHSERAVHRSLYNQAPPEQYREPALAESNVEFF